ncbi:hypothetical protein [Klebsiella oxytoca]|uniref:hypothetical protein n=1 Tax=Klebsiella oxytoca TaxID=571 RepID=UPI00190EE1AA|nr:hypothetical protein [Klebsiella oxytoca]HBM2885809.1 hypothetical protein [Klebsiella oxytoca]
MEKQKVSDEIQQAIELIRDVPGVPVWMLDPANYGDQKPLTSGELYEFAEFHTKQLRTNAAMYYLSSCSERFGYGEKGQQIFRAPGVVVEIDQNVIETLLIYQIERYVMEEKPEEKYLAPMRFYQGDEVNRKENGSTWLIDFIDSVFIEGANEFKNLFNNCDSTTH